MPHSGCPCSCSFCNQRHITGNLQQPKPRDVYDAAERARAWFGTAGNEAEIAFFGGSFTAIDRDYMEALLAAAKDIVDTYRLKGIRISTRPDCIDTEVLCLLKAYGVTAIELGAQSMCDKVLEKNSRGHTAADVENASRLIKESGFELGLQMMTGLYGDTPDKALETAGRLIALEPKTIRIYPAIVLRGTALAEMAERGIYRPQGLDEAVELCAELMPLFQKAGIKVIRVGLHDEESLRENILAGPYHPAFRELCSSRIFLNKALPMLLAELARSGCIKYNIRVNPVELSGSIGQKRQNIKAFAQNGLDVKIIPDGEMSPGSFKIACT